MNNGIFITFEGPNGSGKSSILNAVSMDLKDRGFNVDITKEPTSTNLGKFVLESEKTLSGKSFACLVAADRHAHIDNEIVPALNNDRVVLCDRYIESSLALQRLDGVDIDFIWLINQGILVPDLSVVLTAPEEVLKQRINERSKLSRFEATKGRGDELNMYKEAVKFISSKGFNVLEIDNGKTPIVANSKRVIDRILDIHRRKVDCDR